MSIETLATRLNYRGGNQQQRFINDKLRGLKKALLYSYQAATAILSDGREFRCLINPDKNKPAYDNKIISIPYKDICLNKERLGKTSQGEQEIGMKPGDVFTWKETNTHWLVYLQYLEQDAYFRSDIRYCEKQIEVNNKSYWVYIRGPVQTAIEWAQKAGIEWNSLNYSLVMYITADDNTKSYFERFKTIKILDPKDNKYKTWQVSGVDPYYGNGIIQVFLKEHYENSIQDQITSENKENSVNISDSDTDTPYIKGPVTVKQYSKAYFSIENLDQQGKWYVLWDEEQKDLNSNKKAISLNIDIGKLGIFTLIYRVQGRQDTKLDVTIIPI